MPRSKYILQDDVQLPILGWLGPPADHITPQVMADMAGAGFNLTMADLPDDQMIKALDIAQGAGVRLLVRSKVFDLGRMTPEQGRNFKLAEEHKHAIRTNVDRLKDHPALYGYYIHDEPRLADYPWIAAVIAEIESMDDYHMCYVNHNAPMTQGGYGAGTQEALWRAWIEMTNPKFLSYDHYCIEQKPRDVIDAMGADAPNVFGGIVVKPSYFACLDMARNFSVIRNLPLWAFTCSVPHWSYPWPTEGHIRFQLMCNLAYGVRGLQYFTYWGDTAIAGPNGRTATYDIAKRINAEMQILWQKLKPLRSIGVHHTGPVWEGTTSLMLDSVQAWGDPSAGPVFQCVGDPVVLGIFDDPHGNFYVLVVNKNPVEGASVSLEPELDDTVPHKWHPLRPGEGRLFRLRDDGPPVAM